MRILAVDDEEHILKLYNAILTGAGYEVVTAHDGEEALNIYYQGKIDLIICDEMMPNVTGNQLIKEIRYESKNIPIIMVTAKSSIDDKGISYDLGVDDYMVKPINKEELLMRISALFRRAKIFTEKKIIIGDVVLDSNTHSVVNEKKNLCVNLTKKEFDILFKLFSYPEKAFTKWQLFNEFWGIDSDTDESVVKVFILKIRKKIEVFPEIEIQTLMGIGYRGIKNE